MLAGKEITASNHYQSSYDTNPATEVAKYTRSRFGLILAALGMFGHMVLMVPMAMGWLVCLRPVLGQPLTNTPSPATPFEWCVCGMMCPLSMHAALVVLAETKTFETFTRSQERFRTISMAAFAIAPVMLGALRLDPYPAVTMPSARTFLATILLSMCWLGLAWLRFRQMNVARLAS